MRGFRRPSARTVASGGTVDRADCSSPSLTPPIQASAAERDRWGGRRHLTYDVQGLRKLRIIAVDDEMSNLLLLKQILERDGYEHVDLATDATQVPAMFVERRPDLVLLD